MYCVCVRARARAPAWEAYVTTYKISDSLMTVYNVLQQWQWLAQNFDYLLDIYRDKLGVIYHRDSPVCVCVCVDFFGYSSCRAAINHPLSMQSDIVINEISIVPTSR